jgi:hypothetical protein
MTTTQPITVDGGDLSLAIRDVLPHAGADFPVLDVVCLETSNGVLGVTATDRYTMGQSRIGCAGHLDGPVVINADDARLVARLLKSLLQPPFRYTRPCSVTLAADDGRLRVSYEAQVVTGMPADLNLSFVTTGGDFPKNYQKLLEPAGDAELGGPIGLNPHLLARFAKPCERANMVAKFAFHTETSAVRVTVGDAFTGLIMPVRLAAHTRRDERDGRDAA